VSVALQKVDGVTSVNVTLKEGRAKVTLKQGNHVTLSELRRVIERNGFTPQSAAIVGEAEAVLNASGQSQIRITGSNETFLVAPTTTENVRAELTKQTGKRIVVEGVVAAAKDNPTGAMEVKAVKPPGR
jgi:copper chaperone CopZ